MNFAAAPLILTLRLEDAAARHFNSLREIHFPPALNVLPAHITLFHHLPGSSLQPITAELTKLCHHQQPISVTVSGLRFLGRGVAYRLESPCLSSIRRQLARLWESTLTPQDKQPFQPHITIQNKVSSREARTLYQLLSASFYVRQISGLGLDLWHYRGGPWEPAAHVPFIGPASKPLHADESPSSPPH